MSNFALITLFLLGIIMNLFLLFTNIADKVKPTLSGKDCLEESRLKRSIQALWFHILSKERKKNDIDSKDALNI